MTTTDVKSYYIWSILEKDELAKCIAITQIANLHKTNQIALWEIKELLDLTEGF